MAFLQNKIQEKFNPPAAGGSTASQMNNLIFPIFIGIISVTFPAGLIMYWTVSSAVTIAQNYFINKRLEASAEGVQKA